MDLQLTGMRALVVGGTRGIGRATVRRFAAEGANVAFCGRGQAGVETLAGEIAGSHGFAGDAAGDAGVFQAQVEAAIRALGGLDILVTCVTASGMKFDEAGFRENFEVDVIGTYRSITAALPALKDSKAPSVVNIASIAATEEFGGPQSFNSMKTATIVYLHQLVHAHAPVRFNSVCPGPSTRRRAPGAGWSRTCPTPSPQRPSSSPPPATACPRRWRRPSPSCRARSQASSTEPIS